LSEIPINNLVKQSKYAAIMLKYLKGMDANQLSKNYKLKESHSRKSGRLKRIGKGRGFSKENLRNAKHLRNIAPLEKRIASVGFAKKKVTMLVSVLKRSL